MLTLPCQLHFISRRVNTPTFRSDILKRNKQAQPASRLEIPRCSAAGCQFHYEVFLDLDKK
jgi:hypothetical protein